MVKIKAKNLDDFREKLKAAKTLINDDDQEIIIYALPGDKGFIPTKDGTGIWHHPAEIKDFGYKYGTPLQYRDTKILMKEVDEFLIKIKKA